MRNIFIGFLGVFAIFGLAACGHDPKHLDRDFAKELLTKVVAQRPLTIDLSTGEASAGDKKKSELSFGQADGDGTPEGNALAKAGLVNLRYYNSCPRLDDCYDPKYVLTATGRRLASSWQVVSKKGGTIDYTITVGAEQIGDVTGIQQVMDASHSLVIFDCTLVPNAIGKYLISQVPAIIVGVPLSGRPFNSMEFISRKQQCSAGMTLYDDGWRVDS
jgi:hypothetical protein